MHFAGDNIAQTFAVGFVELEVHFWAAHVCVDDDHVLSALRFNDGEVCRDSGLAF